MQQTPRLQLTSIAQVRLLGNVSVGLENFKKGDVVSVSNEDATALVSSKRAERVASSENLESVNRVELIKEPKPTATEKALAELAEEAQGDNTADGTVQRQNRSVTQAK